jgi:hypothetical protein
MDDGTVLYKSIYDVYGFSFKVVGATFDAGSGLNGGDAQENGFLVYNGGVGQANLVLAYNIDGSHIPAGCGVLTHLNLSGDAEGLAELYMASIPIIPNTQENADGTIPDFLTSVPLVFEYYPEIGTDVRKSGMVPSAFSCVFGIIGILAIYSSANPSASPERFK